MALRSTSPARAAPTRAACSRPSSLRSSSHRPRKRFGQHFLHEARVVARIVDSISPRPGEPIVEIGPGEGALTRPLLERAGALNVIELDRDLAREIAGPGISVHQ